MILRKGVEAMNYLKALAENFHSAAVATVDEKGRPQLRAIDIMLWDKDGLYFLTARGKAFYKQLMEQGFVALTAIKGKASISLSGYVKNIHKEKLDEIFEHNTYMKEIYPKDTREALEVFCIYKARGEFFSIENPAHIVRESFSIGCDTAFKGYFVGEGCIGCKLCYSVCPQKCIDISEKPAVIDSTHCLSCGRCKQICPKQIIRYIE